MILLFRAASVNGLFRNFRSPKIARDEYLSVKKIRGRGNPGSDLHKLLKFCEFLGKEGPKMVLTAIVASEIGLFAITARDPPDS
jgi:hypothetical protein